MSEERNLGVEKSGTFIARERSLKRDWHPSFTTPDHTIFVFQKDTNGELVLDDEGHMIPVFRGTPPAEAKPKI